MTNNNKNLSRRILSDYISCYKRNVTIAIFFMIIVALTTMFNAWVIEPALQEIFINKDKAMLYIIPAAVFIVGLVKAIATYFQSVIMQSMGHNVVISMQKDLYKKLIYGDIAMFANSSSGDLVSRFSNDIYLIRKNLTQILVGSVRESITLVGLIGLMFYQSWQLALVVLLVMPLAILPVAKLGRRMRKLSKQTQGELANLTAKLDDTFKAAKIVKSYTQENYEISKANSKLNDILRIFIKSARVQSAASPITECLGGLAAAGVVLYGGIMVLDDASSMTAGKFFSFMTALLMAYKPLKTLSSINTRWQESLAAIERFYHIMDRKSTIKDTGNAKDLIIKNADISISNLHFSYNENISAINGLDLEIKSGQRIAFVGASGSGKSTMINLLQRFYDPTKGKIKIDGQDITEITQKSLRDNIAVVSQEAVLFDDTIANNIAYGKENASEVEIINAAKQAFADGFINEQEHAYQTQVGQSGAKLSGGQRQRIAIARAILKDAPILLLDEATSALDNESEKYVQDALNILMKSRTTIIVAHRLSTIVAADKIVVMNKGKIVEQGTHDELYNAKGAYYKLYEQQS